MSWRGKFKHSVGDILLFKTVASDEGEIVIVTDGPLDDGLYEHYRVFSFTRHECREIGVGSYIDIHSQRLS